MGRGSSGFGSAARGAALVLSFAASAGAMDAGASERDAAVSCATSASCGFPTPYCSPRLHSCVECVADRNCPDGEVCDVDHGACHGCNMDGDCSGLRPYCDTSKHACVECFTDANCGTMGEKCSGGKCGSCGDGICGRNERIDGYSDPTGTSATVGCPEDCSPLCPAADLKSQLGRDLLSGTFAGRHQLFSICYVGGDAPDLPVTWKAPHDGVFFLSSTGTPLSLTEWAGGCDGEQGANYGCLSILPTMAAPIMAKEGDTFTFVLRPIGDPRGTYSLSITDHDPFCDSGDCSSAGGPGVTPPPSRDAGVTTTASALCLDNARARKEDVCAGVECACSHCPQDYDDCAVIPGCHAVSDCMREKSCVGADCYVSGACRNVVDTYGGVSGPAFRAAAGLQSCALSLHCELPCNAGSVTDAGALDGGQACEPERTVACACEGGLDGKKKCLADGSGFGDCACSEPPLTPASAGNGCNCRVGGRNTENPTVALLGAGVALCFARRRRRRGGRGRR